MVLKLQNVCVWLQNTSALSAHISTASEPPPLCIRHHSAANTKATHTHSHVSKTHKMFKLSTFRPTDFQKRSWGILAFRRICCLFNFITTCLCERDRDSEGGRWGDEHMHLSSRPEEDTRCPAPSLCLIFSRQGVSLNLELGWWLQKSSCPHAHRTGVTAGLLCGCWTASPLPADHLCSPFSPPSWPSTET